jgi:WD40 repeat protein
MRRGIVLATAFMLTIYLFLPSFDLGAQKASVASITALEWNPDATKFATGDQDGVVTIRNAATNQLVLTLIGHSARINDVKWSPDGTRLASVSNDKAVRIWNTINGESVHVLQAHLTEVASVAWNAAGSIIASSSDVDESNALRIWNPTTGNLISTHVVSGSVDIAWSPDGGKLAGAIPGGWVLVLDTTTFEYEDGFELKLSSGGQRGIFAVTWSPNNLKIASGSNDGSVVIWDAVSKQLLFDLRGNDLPPTNIKTSLVLSLAFSSDGRKLVSVCSDGTIRTWNATSGQVLSTIRINGPLEAAALSRDGQKLVYSRSKGTIQVISLNF